MLKSKILLQLDRSRGKEGLEHGNACCGREEVRIIGELQ